MQSSTLNKQQQALETIEDPVLFAQRILGDSVWSKQQEILESVAKHPRTAARACHASGKTFSAAEVVLWWITSQLEAIAVTTAPTWTQVERLIWGEIHRAAARSKINYPKPASTFLELGPNRYAIGLSTNEGVRFQGFHGNVLIVLDEAPGILPEIWEAIEGIRAGGDVRVLALGNPTIASGPFYDAFTSARNSWNLISISAFDTPNLQGITLDDLSKMSDEELDSNSHPYLTTRRWVREKYYEWGPGHPLWEARVMGNFPTQSEDALFALSWLEAAKGREGGDGEVCAGLDVAGPGEDETVLCVRRGPLVLSLKTWSNKDPRGDVVAALMPYKTQLKSVNVDSVGIGYYMARHLRDVGFKVQEINVGEAAHDKEKFANLKAELYWGLRQRAESGDLAGLRDETAIGQLAGIRYHHNSRGQVVIESKEEARKRGVKSPDRAEALMLAFAKREQVYPLLEYCKRLEAERNKPANDEPPEGGWECPECHSKCVAVLLHHEKHCNICGWQWGLQVERPQWPNRYEMERRGARIIQGSDWLSLPFRRGW